MLHHPLETVVEPPAGRSADPVGPPPGFLVRRRRLVLWLAALGLAVAALAGHGVHDRLTFGGATVPGAESARAAELLERGFAGGDPHLVVIVRSTQPVDGARIARAGSDVAARLARDPGVARVTSYWEARSPGLRSRDGRAALIVARLHGDDMHQTATAARLAPGLTGAHGPLTLSVTGEAQVKAEARSRSESDLRRAELITVPLTVVILLLVFGSLTAAVLPVLVGVFAVTGTTAVLRLLTEVTEVSAFAMSIASALGFALAVDFSLFIVTRFREELAGGRDAASAIRVTLRTTGRAMAFSAFTVSSCLAALLLFPFTMFRSVAFGGIAVTLLAAVGSLVVLPAVLAVLGTRIDCLAVPEPWRAARGRAAPGPEGRWFRLAEAVMRRPLAVAVPTVVLLVAVASPFLGARFGVFDDRLLPPEAPAALASEDLRRDFDARDGISATTVVLPGLKAAGGGTAAPGRTPPGDAHARPNVRVRSEARVRLDAYARRVSALEGVARVSTATGSYRDGGLAGPPPGPPQRFTSPAGAWLAVATDHEPYSVENSELARAVRSVPAPGPAVVGGPGAQLADIRQAVADALPQGLALVVLTTFVLITVMTRSVVLAVKALVMNALSLGATFGVLVHVFQEGHLRELVGGFSVTGTLDVLVPALMFCIAFGLSMDYEIFLLSRITEEYRRTGDTRAAVATGMEHTGRLFTSAAVIFAVVMASLATSGLVLLKMVGVGLALAVLLDCTLIRALLVPAVMCLAGRANWWSPLRAGPVRRRAATSESTV
ncbi:MMPL family transporter [Planomonospora parontospora]|uniref:MMPL family transporter n=1 Tax=Planomonospora parontospora TaxID=58119 RepID=UPI0016712C58|nr:MMPL family transporter [Planomonospora parontospora]GGL54298.1 membrane protein [Planomonospora parontospora subsp. antibiotica]GII13748.1 membrane protein [Planomonospora parontospora subsp. antibiotica]